MAEPREYRLEVRLPREVSRKLGLLQAEMQRETGKRLPKSTLVSTILEKYLSGIYKDDAS